MEHDINPLLLNPQLPAFDRITPAQAEPAIHQIIETAEQELETLEHTAESSWDGCMAPLLALGEPLDYAWGIISHLHGVMNSPEWRSVHEKLIPKVVAFSSRLARSEPICRALRNLRDSPQWPTLDEARQRLTEAALREAEAAGVGLAPEKRERLQALREQLAADAATFSNHLLDATKAWSLPLTTEAETDGLPASLLQSAASAAQRTGYAESTLETGPWVITLEAPLFVPFMQYSRRRDLRETLYRAFVTRAAEGDTDNTALIIRILKNRANMAALLGYRSFAEFKLRSRMAPSIAAIDALTERLRVAARPAAECEHAELTAFAREHGQQEPLMHWDVAFWAERMRKARFEVDDEDLRPYFQFPTVLSTLFEIAHQLFGITLVAADGKTPVWHPDVRFFEVLDEHDTVMAGFYLDPYSRPETKRGGAWMDAVRPRQRRADGTTVPPVAYMVCNQSLPENGKPSLMTLTEVTTLFHEFGHALQHLLTTVDIPAASGIHNVEWDAIELSSQFMENWCYHCPVLLGMSKHIETGASLSPTLLTQICKARTYRSGSGILRQLLFGAIDMELHHRRPPESTESPDATKARIAETFTVLPMLPEDRFLCGFAHIFAGGYAAGYYSYKWAEVLSADAFAVFEEAGLDNTKSMAHHGKRFRDTVLALGGSRDPMAVFKDFRGRDPDPEALLRQEGLLPAASQPATRLCPASET